jgi:hypothetical protein
MEACVRPVIKNLCVRKRSSLAAALIALLLFVLPFGRLSAQIDTGGVTGTVKDSSGAIVPNAHVTLTANATSVARATNSTSTGTYVFDSVPPGNYTIEVSGPGFETAVEHDLIVHVQQVQPRTLAAQQLHLEPLQERPEDPGQNIGELPCSVAPGLWN